VTDIPVSPSGYPLEYQALCAQLPIDLMNLGEELMRMPQLVQDAAELASLASNEESACLMAVDIIKAETGQQLRQENEKITEAAIERSLPLFADVLEARTAYNHAKTYAKLCEDLVRSLRTKSMLLQKAGDLIVAGYITPAAIYQRRRDDLNAARQATPRTD
jgi:hypothetical protein